MWYGEALMKHEKEYQLAHQKELAASKHDLEALRSYWGGKSWLSKAVKERLATFLDETEGLLRDLGPSIDLNVIPLALVYMAWAEEVPDDRARIQFFRSRSVKDWVRVRKAINQAMREIEENLLPFYRFHPQGEPMLSKTKEIIKSLELLQECDLSLLSKKWYAGFVLDMNGFKRQGKLPDRRANNVLYCLSQYFKRKTGQSKYAWLADIFSAAFKTGADKAGIIRRIKKAVSNDFGVLIDEKADANYLEIIDDTWRHILEESGSWDGPPRKPIPMPRRLSEKAGASHESPPVDKVDGTCQP